MAVDAALEIPAALAGEPPHRARVHGQALERFPADLYIPPDALEVFLEAFEGPLDLLLYLIRKQNLDILDIPVLRITEQYLEYIRLSRALRLERAADYLLMAAWLAEIKSRMLLPRPVLDDGADAGDPRVELVRRLQEYERFKTAAERLDALARVGREVFPASAKPERPAPSPPPPVPGLDELLRALRDVMLRAELFTHHRVEREPLSVRERMSRLLGRLRCGPKTLVELLDLAEGRAGVVVCLLAILELAKLSMIEIVQEAPFGELWLDLARAREAPPRP